MGTASGKLSTEHTGIGGQNWQPQAAKAEVQQIQGHKPDKNVRPISFHDLATFAFPDKTDQHLSFLTGADVRTCRRWRAGATEPPAEALRIIIVEIMKRFQRR